MLLPPPVGPVSSAVAGLLTEGTWASTSQRELDRRVRRAPHFLTDHDCQLALACCYELHYRGFDDVDDRLEWSPQVASAVATLEDRFERELCAAVPVPGRPGSAVHEALRELVDEDPGPPLSTYFLRDAGLDHVRDFLVQRSIYQLKEADPHTWAIPRLDGRAKAALVEIQADEYGGGRPAAMHAELFRRAMQAMGLDDRYGAYLSEAFAETLAAVNAVTMFGLHRRLRGALLGHLAALEMTSTTPNRRYANGLRRLGLGPDVTAYFDEHVEADAVHEQIAAIDMCGSFVAATPALRDQVLWGAACCLALDAAASTALLRTWQATGDVATEGAA